MGRGSSSSGSLCGRFRVDGSDGGGEDGSGGDCKKKEEKDSYIGFTSYRRFQCCHSINSNKDVGPSVLDAENNVR